MVVFRKLRFSFPPKSPRVGSCFVVCNMECPVLATVKVSTVHLLGSRYCPICYRSDRMGVPDICSKGTSTIMSYFDSRFRSAWDFSPPPGGGMSTDQ